MPQETKHTPVPWRTENSDDLERHPSDRPDIVMGNEEYRLMLIGGTTQVSTAQIKANAAFIVQACNCHEELLEACRQAVFAIPTTHGAFETLRAAIRKAEGGE